MDVIAEIKYPLLKQFAIARHGLWADVRRHSVKCFAFAQHSAYAVLDHHHRVSLPKTQTFGTLASQRSNRRNAGNAADKAGENIRHADFRLETELESDIRNSVAIVVDMHFIENVGIERKIIGSVGGFQEPVDV